MRTLCGPEAEGDVKFELFTSAGSAKPKAKLEVASNANTVPMQVVLDGVSMELDKDKNMLDAALDAGLDAPYSCLGGVCCTCRAKLVEGKASMNVNYALEPGEVERGYVLACQAHVEGDGPVVLEVHRPRMNREVRRCRTDQGLPTPALDNECPCIGAPSVLCGRHDDGHAHVVLQHRK